LDGWAAPYTLNQTFVDVSRHSGCDHQYTWGIVHGVNLANVLRIPRVSIIEFGVSGGRSLLAMEMIATKIESIYPVKIDVYGFDTGAGLSKPLNYADMPNLWSEGAFPMDFDKLSQRLKRAKLVIGPVSNTVPAFINTNIPPVAFIGFDVDLYSSTKHALQIFDSTENLLLPRVYCLFDDILGYTFGDHVGERLAITEFNHLHEKRKISPIYGLHHYVPRYYKDRMWEKNYMVHIFDHPLYNKYDGSIPLIAQQSAHDI
jgi:hypothetical protein